MNRIWVIVFLFVAQVSFAQHEDVLKGEEGDVLLQHLVQNYKPSTVLDYGNARRKMFGEVDNLNDSIYCIYTNYAIYINPNEDPKADAFAKGINTEHSFPQSKGATGQAKSNVHHLFPTLVEVNGERGHVPFEDIPDNLTDSWYYLAIKTSDIPATNIDQYSESDKGIRFEPPEAQKGNIARAVMYFYTMYKQQADNADNGYFQGMLPSICQWHYEDEVDQREWDRTWAIAEFQSNKPNPFVLDCTLAERSYCSDMEFVCMPDAIGDIHNTIQSFGAHPNPTSLTTKIRFTLDEAFTKGQVVVYTVTGQQVFKKNIKGLMAGANEFRIDLTNWKSGFYIYSILIDGAVASGKLVVY